MTLDGGGCTAQAGDTLSSIAARLLSPFEQLTREALLWAAESAQLSVQQAQAALGEPASALPRRLGLPLRSLRPGRTWWCRRASCTRSTPT